MSKLISCIFAMVILVGCNQQQPSPKETQQKTDSIPSSKSSADIPKDSLIRITSTKILQFLKSGDYTSLAAFVHPNGVILSPYGYIDTTSALVLKADDLRADSSNSKRVWGHYDGSGDPIQLTREQYFRKFVYNADYLHADTVGLNTIIGKGNSLNNLPKIFPGSSFIEYHFRGFEKKYQGMDWSSLRLVFSDTNGQLQLVAIIHDQWTT